MKRILTTFSDKWPEYLIEAIVIIASILGAYALDSWNEQRDERGKEKAYLESINQEFIKNREQFIEITAWHNVSRKALLGILSEYDKPNPNADSLKKHHLRAWLTFTFDPSQSSIKSLLSVSSLDLIQNEELRALLMSWSDLVIDYKGEELTSEAYFYERIRPYMESNFKHHNSVKDNELIYGKALNDTFESIIRYRIGDLTYIIENSNLENPYPENEKIRIAMNRIIELSELK